MIGTPRKTRRAPAHEASQRQRECLEVGEAETRLDLPRYATVQLKA
jgi:hypothetical protein